MECFWGLIFSVFPISTTWLSNTKGNDERLKSSSSHFCTLSLVLHLLFSLATAFFQITNIFHIFFPFAHPKMINFFRKLSRGTTNERWNNREAFCQRHTRFFPSSSSSPLSHLHSPWCVLFSLPQDFVCGEEGKFMDPFCVIAKDGDEIVCGKREQQAQTTRATRTRTLIEGKESQDEGSRIYWFSKLQLILIL